MSEAVFWLVERQFDKTGVDIICDPEELERLIDKELKQNEADNN